MEEKQFGRSDGDVKLKSETLHSEFNKEEMCMKNDLSASVSSNSGFPNISKLSYENKKRNKYRMLGTDLKRKAVHLVSFP